MNAKYISGALVSEGVADDYRDSYNAVEAGARLQIPVTERLHVGGDAGFHVPLPVSTRDHRPARLQFSVATTEPRHVKSPPPLRETGLTEVVELSGFEPLTSAVRLQRSTN